MLYYKNSTININKMYIDDLRKICNNNINMQTVLHLLQTAEYF